MNLRLKRPFLSLFATASLLVAASVAIASPAITLSEVQAQFPDYVNHEQMNGFQAPCVDASGTLVINANVADIMGTVSEDIAVAMVCQAPGYPAFTPLGPVTFSDSGMSLLNLASVPGHPDAFAIEFIVPFGLNSFTISIENTGWPEGCITDILDFAAWDLASVPVEIISIGSMKSQY